MKYLMKFLPRISILVLIDQLIKIVIKRLWFEADIAILGDVVRFAPKINTKLSWGAHFIDILRNPVVINVLNVIVLLVFISAYSYYRSQKEQPTKAANAVYVLGVSGTLCSLIDKLFWGGSLDYIQLIGLFTFDLKDCFITLSIVVFLIGLLIHRPKISILDYLSFCFKKKV